MEMGIRELESSTRNPISEEPKSINEEEKKKENVKEKKSEEDMQRKVKEEIQQDLHDAIRDKKVEWVFSLLDEYGVQLTDKVTSNGNTIIHLAVIYTKDTEFLTDMLTKGLKDKTKLNVQNSDGSTPLHVAAIIGNTEAAKILVDNNKNLLVEQDNKGHIPLAIALSNMHTDTYLYLLDQTKFFDTEMNINIQTSGAHELVANAISSKDFDSARNLCHIFGPKDSDVILMAVAQNFPSEVNIWERIVHKISHREDAKNYIFDDSESDLFDPETWSSLEKYTRRPWMYPLFASVWPIKILLKKADLYEKASLFLYCNLKFMIKFRDPKTLDLSIRNPIFEATQENASMVVEMIVDFFPNAIWCENEDGHNIMQNAVVHRSEKVYNLLSHMRAEKDIYRTIKDPLGNNLLHLAARLAPPNKLNLISGAALQLQRELQWFEEVKKFICPLNITQKNSFGETPEMVFRREHMNLVSQGEKWMKGTSGSYTITAALITTIMFAAAITVPGGNNDNSGIPVFIREVAFKIFAVSDAISLLSSIISLVIFLSFHSTARFAEQDFLFELPTKLVIGLITLFISTTAMIIAFGATVFLVFGKSESSILVHLAIWSSLPIAFFVLFHFPLVIKLVSATYGYSIFHKKNDQPIIFWMMSICKNLRLAKTKNY